MVLFIALSHGTELPFRPWSTNWWKFFIKTTAIKPSGRLTIETSIWFFSNHIFSYRMCGCWVYWFLYFFSPQASTKPTVPTYTVECSTSILYKKRSHVPISWSRTRIKGRRKRKIMHGSQQGNCINHKTCSVMYYINVKLFQIITSIICTGLYQKCIMLLFRALTAVLLIILMITDILSITFHFIYMIR